LAAGLIRRWACEGHRAGHGPLASCIQLTVIVDKEQWIVDNGQ